MRWTDQFKYLVLRLTSLALVGLFLGAVPQVAAQPTGDINELVEQIELAYENLEYHTAESLARQVLREFEGLSPDQLVRVHTTLALVLFVKGEEFEAAEQFRSALSINPDLELDPVLVSPGTLEFFEEVKQLSARQPPATDESTGEVRYVMVEDVRPGATLRSVILPGWGQQHKGENTKGWVITGAWAATLAASTYAHFQRQDAREAYLNETNPDLVEVRYESYNNWHTLRGGLLIGAAAVWAYAAIDALAIDTRTERGGLNVQATPAGFGIRYSF